MGRIIVTEFITLDGRIDDPGEWTPDHFNDEIQQLKNDEYFGAAALLFGRVTFDIHAGAWPTVHDAFGDRLNTMPKYVASATADPGRWNNTERIDATPQALTALKDHIDGDVLVDGSRQLVNLLLACNLVDQIDLLVFPVLHGQGKTLFDAHAKAELQLLTASTTATGVVHLTYATTRRQPRDSQDR